MSFSELFASNRRDVQIFNISQIDALPTLRLCTPRTRNGNEGGRVAKSPRAPFPRHSVSSDSIAELLSSEEVKVVVKIFIEGREYCNEEERAVTISISHFSTAESVCADVSLSLGLYNDLDFSLFQYRNGFHRRLREDETIAEVLSAWTPREIDMGTVVSISNVCTCTR